MTGHRVPSGCSQTTPGSWQASLCDVLRVLGRGTGQPPVLAPQARPGKGVTWEGQGGTPFPQALQGPLTAGQRPEWPQGGGMRRELGGSGKGPQQDCPTGLWPGPSAGGRGDQGLLTRGGGVSRASDRGISLPPAQTCRLGAGGVGGGVAAGGALSPVTGEGQPLSRGALSPDSVSGRLF